MLPPANRMHRASEFTSVVRSGDRLRARTIVIHHLPSQRAAAAGLDTNSAVVGLVVSKAVGNSVVRHRVSRRLRAVLAARLTDLPQGTGTVVRALPPSATAPSHVLAADVDRALARRATRT